MSGREGFTLRIPDEAGTKTFRYQDVIERFLQDHNLKGIVAFSGGLDPKDPDAERKASDLLHAMLGGLNANHFAVQTGGTKWGIPFLGNLAARNQNMKTIGVYPRRGRKHALPPDLLDLAIEVGPFAVRPGTPDEEHGQWGDESPVFASLADVMVVIGGGPGAEAEVSLAMKRNGGGVRPTVVVPVLGSGGIADLLLVIAEAIYPNASHFLKPVTSADEVKEIIMSHIPYSKG
ncbi:MAG: hypothetical protein HGB18_02600 [Candidatus Moranbacteria bacterium]|nr:hypothetical protein [Candidatus Moranbacteria bacterium]